MDNGARVSTPQLLVDSVLHLISLPEIYLRLQETIDDPLHSREQIAEIVAYDPALSARVLRIANSSYYGFPREIETVGSAVGLATVTPKFCLSPGSARSRYTHHLSTGSGTGC
jgi:c-di-GMP-related signal transduction protein